MGKISKSDDSQRRAQENQLLNKWHDAMIEFCRTKTDEALAEWLSIGEQYKRQFDHR